MGAFSKETMKYQIVLKYLYKNLLNIVLIPIIEKKYRFEKNK